MKHLHFEPEADGFYGAYWESKTPSDIAMIAMLGDDPEDYMGKTCVKWCCLPRKTQKVGNHGISRNKAE